MNNFFVRTSLMLLTSFFWGSLVSTGHAESDVNAIPGSTTVESVKESPPDECEHVNSDAIELEITAQKDLSSAAKNDVDGKIRSKYIPVRISIINKSGKLLKIPRENVYLINSNGEKVALPSEAEIFEKVKRNGVVRAAAWGVPIGVCSFGLLAGPTVVASGAHTKITNGTVKANIQKNCFRGGHISPEGSISTMIFIPKRKNDVQKIALGRVINTEDEIETEKIVDITTSERKTEKKHLAIKQ